jgi:hypothetical protein
MILIGINLMYNVRTHKRSPETWRGQLIQERKYPLFVFIKSKPWHYELSKCLKLQGTNGVVSLILLQDTKPWSSLWYSSNIPLSVTFDNLSIINEVKTIPAKGENISTTTENRK